MKAPATSRVRPAVIVLAAIVTGTVIAAPFYFSHKEASAGDHVSRMANTHDMAQHLAVMEQFDKVLRTGVVYPRWLPDVNNGYGLAWTNFYPPGFYYVTSVANAVLNDWAYTLFVISCLSLAASGLAFYLLSIQFYSPLASAIGALFYMAAPYHVLDLYWRGAMPEFVGFVLVPLIIYFAFKLGAYGRARYYAGLGLVHGLFLLIHIPVAFLMTYALAFFAVVWAARERDPKIAVRVFAGMALAFAVGAIYLLPAFLEIGQAAEHFSAIFPYHSSYITLLNGGDSFAKVMNLSFAAHAVVLLTAVFILRRVSRSSTEEHDSKPERRESQTRLWIIMGLATTFMCTSLSIYVSKLIPKIDVASFAWRWLVIAGLFAALVVAAAIDRLRENTGLNARWLLVCRGSICAAILFSFWITAHDVMGRALSNPALNPPPNFLEAGFTPKGSTDPRDLPDTARVIVEPQSQAAEIVRWEPYHREVHVNVSTPSSVRFKTYNFPGWLALVDDKPTPMLSDKDGVQVVEVPEGVHRIEASFVNTLPRTVGALLSALGLLGVIGLAAGDRLRESRSAAERASPASGGLVRTLKALAPVLAPALIGVVLLFWLSSRGSSSGTPPSGPAASPGSAATGGNTRSQNEQGSAMLHLDGVPSILVAVDERALNELMNALPAKDNAKVDALVDSGRLLRVSNDLRVRVLESGAGMKKVRILEGEYLMAEGWVSERWIR
ncbi:MAG: 6-pyruvoyl-tetrahydropterin synthase-related protein [Acidobacteriota bacterium]